MESREENFPEWGEERLRYRVLRSVYERSGANCVNAISGAEIGTELGLAYEDLFRVLAFLEDHEYLFRVDAGPRVCITPKGIRYMERTAGRRQSLRASAAA